MHLSTVVRTLAALFALAGIVFALQPEILKGLLRLAIKGRTPYVVGILRICLGLLFVWVGGNLHARFLGVIGAVVLVAGIMGLVLKLETQKRITTRLIDSSEMTLRMVGIVAAIIGSLVLIDIWPK